MYTGLNVKHPWFLSHFNQTCISLTDLRKGLKYQIPSKSVQWKPTFSMEMDGQTDIVNNRFSQLCEKRPPVGDYEKSKFRTLKFTNIVTCCHSEVLRASRLLSGLFLYFTTQYVFPMRGTSDKNGAEERRGEVHTRFEWRNLSEKKKTLVTS